VTERPRPFRLLGLLFRLAFWLPIYAFVVLLALGAARLGRGVGRLEHGLWKATDVIYGLAGVDAGRDAIARRSR
jgi:hypothetical protein